MLGLLSYIHEEGDVSGRRSVQVCQLLWLKMVKLPNIYGRYVTSRNITPAAKPRPFTIKYTAARGKLHSHHIQTGGVTQQWGWLSTCGSIFHVSKNDVSFHWLIKIKTRRESRLKCFEVSLLTQNFVASLHCVSWVTQRLMDERCTMNIYIHTLLCCVRLLFHVYVEPNKSRWGFILSYQSEMRERLFNNTYKNTHTWCDVHCSVVLL